MLEQENELFKVVENKELKCFDLIFKKATYDTSSELMAIVSWVHQLGVNDKSKIRIGAELEEKPKSKLII